MAREALGIVGAAVGFVASGYNPQGAYWGYTIGSAIGGAMAGPTRVPSPGLSEAPMQTSRDGLPIPIIRGLHEAHGNLIQKNPEVIVTTVERQGKGGGGTEVETKQRFRTYAIGIAEPFVEITRIWRNGKLVVDQRAAPAIPAAETAKYLAGVRIYYGDEAQLPDPDLEAHWGADDTPFYRGLGYIVHVDDDLTDTGGAIPTFRFELNGSRDLTITSKPYPIEAVDGMQATQTPVDPIYQFQYSEGFSVAITPQDGTLRTLLHSFTYTEGLEATHTPQAGTLTTKLHQYSWTEGLEATITPTDGTLTVRLISYTVDPEEGLAATITPKDGTLT